MFPITGTLINVMAVIVGGLLGALLGNRLPEKTRQTVLSGLGLMTLIIGITMAIQTTNVLIPLFSILLGGILGEALRIDDGLSWLGRRPRGALAALRPAANLVGDSRRASSPPA